MDILTALLMEQSKYLKLADYAIKQLDTIQAAIRLVEAEAANKPVAEALQADGLMRVPR